MKKIFIILLLLNNITFASGKFGNGKFASTYTKIVVNGVIDVNLQTNFKKPQLTFKGNPQDLKQVQHFIKNNTLYITMGAGYPNHGRVVANIKARHVSCFFYHGSGIVAAKNLNTNNLALNINNEQVTSLRGNIGLNSLKLAGVGTTKISGIHSRHLNILASQKAHANLQGRIALNRIILKDCALVKISGIHSSSTSIRACNSSHLTAQGFINQLDVNLRNRAIFDGKNLQVENSLIKTYGKAIAHINTHNIQHAFATDGSNIYYHQLPAIHTERMAFFGSVLDMRLQPRY